VRHRGTDPPPGRRALDRLRPAGARPRPGPRVRLPRPPARRGRALRERASDGRVRLVRVRGVRGLSRGRRSGVRDPLPRRDLVHPARRGTARLGQMAAALRPRRRRHLPRRADPRDRAPTPGALPPPRERRRRGRARRPPPRRGGRGEVHAHGRAGVARGVDPRGRRRRRHRRRARDGRGKHAPSPLGRRRSPRLRPGGPPPSLPLVGQAVRRVRASGGAHTSTSARGSRGRSGSSPWRPARP
jgi:hypothetical protein